MELWHLLTQNMLALSCVLTPHLYCIVSTYRAAEERLRQHEFYRDCLAGPQTRFKEGAQVGGS